MSENTDSIGMPESSACDVADETEKDNGVDVNEPHVSKNWRYRLGQGLGYAAMSVLVALPLVFLGKKGMKKNG